VAKVTFTRGDLCPREVVQEAVVSFDSYHGDLTKAETEELFGVNRQLGSQHETPETTTLTQVDNSSTIR